MARKQEDLLRDFKVFLFQGAAKLEQFGATSDAMMVAILQRLGFTVDYKHDLRPEVQQEVFEKIDLTTSAVLICANFHLASNHCVRFWGMDQGDSVFVMDPSFNGYRIDSHSISNLIKWNYRFMEITKP